MSLFQSTHSQGVRPISWALITSCHGFQSTHSQGVRRLFQVACKPIVKFQSTHSQGVRQKQQWCRYRLISISIHALTRSATFPLSNMFHLISNFNPRTHKECDHQFQKANTNVLLFQSTHSQGVRQSSRAMINSAYPISIHALTRSATSMLTALMPDVQISIHALTRSATAGAKFAFVKLTISIHALTLSATPKYLVPELLAIFQSTHSQGVRPKVVGTKSVKALISIHALTRSATLFGLQTFNFFCKFQSTHSQGVRRHTATPSILGKYHFNPRTH